MNIVSICIKGNFTHKLLQVQSYNNNYKYYQYGRI